MRLATDFVPCRGVAISSETDVAPCLAFFASSVRSCFVNLLFARYGDDAAPAPITMKNVIVRAPSATRAPPLKPDMPLLSQLSLPQQRHSARVGGGATLPLRAIDSSLFGDGCQA